MKCVYLYIILPVVSVTSRVYANNYLELSTATELHGTCFYTIKQARQYLLYGNLRGAIYEYSQVIQEEIKSRNAGKGVSGELLAEYAYALALNHDYEAALLNIDRAREIGTEYGNFYVRQILGIMGFSDAAYQFHFNNDQIPIWLVNTYNALYIKYNAKKSPDIENPQSALTQADQLVMANQYLQAIAIYEALIEAYPNESVVYLGYSLLWESLGNYSYAAIQLQKGIELLQKNEENINKKKIYSEHLLRLKAIIPRNEMRMIDMGIKGTLYLGGVFAKDNYSVNCRAGIYTKKGYSLSLSYGLGYGNYKSNFNLGCSGYKRNGILMYGLGIGLVETISFKKDADDVTSLDITPSIGLTFLNKSQTSSFDITLGCHIPITKNLEWGYSLTFGKTFYFNLNRKKK